MDPVHVTPPSQRSWLRRLLNRLEVDRAVFFALLARGWQFLTGPVTLVLIARHFTPQEQGFYYTFWSVVGLQSMFELSFYTVIVNVASHEWHKLHRDEQGAIAGDPQARSRLISLGRLSVLWYSVASVLFVVGIGAGGLVFFSVAKESVPGWQGPWLVLVAMSGLAFALTPLQGILEGCNQVASVYRLQFWRGVIGNLVTWVCIPVRCGAVDAGRIDDRSAGLRQLPVRDSLRQLLRRFSPQAGWTRPLDWRREVWPMQWRVGVKGFVLSFTSQLVNPVVFHYHGAAAAGQTGMTWHVLTSLQNVAAAWVKTRIPRFGILVAQRDYRELDRIFFRLSGLALIDHGRLGIAVLSVECRFECYVAKSGSSTAAAGTDRLARPGHGPGADSGLPMGVHPRPQAVAPPAVECRFGNRHLVFDLVVRQLAGGDGCDPGDAGRFMCFSRCPCGPGSGGDAASNGIGRRPRRPSSDPKWMCTHFGRARDAKWIVTSLNGKQGDCELV